MPIHGRRLAARRHRRDRRVLRLAHGGVVERRSEADDRRQEARRVEQERRLGHSDRRVPGSEV
jgi:hypothetical protein